jgi:hypothetical protein
LANIVVICHPIIPMLSDSNKKQISDRFLKFDQICAPLFGSKTDQTLRRLDQCFWRPESETQNKSDFGSSDALFGI